MRLLARIVLPILVLVGGVAVAGWLVWSKVELEPSAPLERVWTVEVAEVAFGQVRPELTLFGEVVAGREVEMRALVAGQVIEVGPAFMDGGGVRKGELLVAIDPFEYRAALDERLAQLAEAKARLREIEARHRSEGQALAGDREQLDITGRDLKRLNRLHAKGTVSQKSLDTAMMAQSKQEQLVSTRLNMMEAEAARLDQQRAVITRLGVAVRRARRDLKQTRVMAPFEGFLLETEAEIGKRVGVNDRLARLIDAGRLEARFHLSDDQFGRILAAEGSFHGRPARVIWRTGAQPLEYAATVDRGGARIDPASGGVELYARLADAGLESPLRAGAFVEVRIADRAYDGVARLPESALHGAGTVYVVEAGRLVAREVLVVARVGADVLVSVGLAAGERVVTTRFAEIGPGVRVEVP
jgi:RND family efflux transporter MFP subunit